MPDRSIRYVHVIARPLKSESGDAEFVGSVMHATVRERALEEIRTLKDEPYKDILVPVSGIATEVASYLITWARFCG
jgi:hypothetical protein